MWSVKQLVEPENPLVQNALLTYDTLVPLKSVREDFVEMLFQDSDVKSVCADTLLFSENTCEKHYLYLQHGCVELQFPSGHSEIISAENTVLPLGHGQSKGCSARTLDDSTVLFIDIEKLDQLLSWSEVTHYLISELSFRRELDEEIEWIQIILNSNLFFKVPPVNAESIFNKFTPMVVSEGDVLMEEGDEGDCCYFIKEGTADVWVKASNSKRPTKVAEITRGRCFGEDALVNDTTRNASIIMSSDGLLMRLEKSDFLTLLQEPAVDELSQDDIYNMFEEPTFIDVRTEDEYSLGHLALSANIPLSLLSIKKRLLAQEKPYVFYCDTGRRSRAAAYLLGKQGYNTYAMKNGYKGQGLSECLVYESGYILRNGDICKSE